MAQTPITALKGLVESLVSPLVPDAEVPAVLANLPGCGDIIPAVLTAREAIRAACNPLPTTDVQWLIDRDGFEHEMGGGGVYFLSRYYPGGNHIYVTDAGGCGMPSAASWMVGVYVYDLEADEAINIWLRSSDDGGNLGTVIKIALERVAEAQQTTDGLTDLLTAFCAREGLEAASADEMLMLETLTPEQRGWLERFCKSWEEVENHEDRNQVIY